ncbi:MAG: cobalamin-dependent protein [Bacteroidales bacterium]|nr:cobalamin-dependent protein [Bacteroidales bacterium]MDD3989487.1 cobalamin-dependent protein [Bacteroidales bacterium]MDD4638371.1 cobalamin-dependent protein [Bacteroidales bacterium]
MSDDIQLDNSDFLNSLLSGNRSMCSKIIQEHLKNQIPVQYLYENIIKKSLYEVGELWESNKITVATEHLASAIVEAILNELYFTIVGGKKNIKSVVVSCVENEFHQIGIKMVSDIFELNGWNSFFLGANTPTNELIKFTKIIKPDILAISLTLNYNLPILERMIQEIRKEITDLPVLVGGQAFTRGGKDAVAKYSNVIYLPNLNAIDLFIKNFQPTN